MFLLKKNTHTHIQDNIQVYGFLLVLSVILMRASRFEAARLIQKVLNGWGYIGAVGV